MMSETNAHLEQLKEIRSLMERSSRFISLSGLSGVFAGAVALIGAAFAWYELKHYADTPWSYQKQQDLLLYLIADAAIVLVLALSGGFLFTWRRSRKKGQSMWDATSRRLVINLFIPLVTGGIFCLNLLYHNYMLVAPATLVFYGLALINASKYTLHDIRYLGFSEIILGLIATFYLSYGIYFWAVGFGVLHILYGTAMYFKYER